MNKCYLLGLLFCFLLWGQSVSAAQPKATPSPDTNKQCLPNLNDYQNNDQYKSPFDKDKSSFDKFFSLADRFCKQSSVDENISKDAFWSKVSNLSIALGKNDTKEISKAYAETIESWNALSEKTENIQFISVDKYPFQEGTETNQGEFQNFISAKVKINGVDTSYKDHIPFYLKELQKLTETQGSKNSVETEIINLKENLKKEYSRALLVTLCVFFILLCFYFYILFIALRTQKKLITQDDSIELLLKEIESLFEEIQNLKVNIPQNRPASNPSRPKSNKTKEKIEELERKIKELEEKIKELEEKIKVIKKEPNQNPEETDPITRKIYQLNYGADKKNHVPNEYNKPSSTGLNTDYINNPEICIDHGSALKLNLAKEAQQALNAGGEFKVNFDIVDSKISRRYHYAAFPNETIPDAYRVYPKIMPYNLQHKKSAGLDYVFENNLDTLLTTSGTGSGIIKQIKSPAVVTYSKADQSWKIEKKGELIFGVS